MRAHGVSIRNMRQKHGTYESPLLYLGRSLGGGGGGTGEGFQWRGSGKELMLLEPGSGGGGGT